MFGRLAEGDDAEDEIDGAGEDVDDGLAGAEDFGDGELVKGVGGAGGVDGDVGSGGCHVPGC